LRPASPYRRHSAIALVFAAWCAAYGLPAELARNLTVQTVGFSQLRSTNPGKQAKVLLDRLSTRVRRAEQVRLAFFDAFLSPSLATLPAISSQASAHAPRVQGSSAPEHPARYQRPPPHSFSA
jgi:hypothetical protein